MMGILVDVSIGIHEILVKLLKNTPGLQHVMLTDSTGLTVANLTRSSSSLELEGIGALTTALFLGMNYQGGELRLGSLGFVFSEFSGGKLIMQSITRDYVLVGIISQRASVQKIKDSVKRFSKPIVNQIDLLKTSRKMEIEVKQDFLQEALSELE
jgi:predicted regulator of Ras-like GTPase activity (Roadblock/LC7/MglB family)